MNGIAQHLYDHPISDALRQNARSPLRSLIKSRRGITLLVVGADLLAVVGSFLLLWVIAVMATDKALPMTPPVLVPTLIGMFWMAVFWFTGVYSAIHNRSLFEEYYAVLKVIVLGFGLIFGLFFLFGPPIDSRSDRVIVLLLYLVLFSVSVAVARLVVRLVVRRLRKRGIGLRRTIIIGESARSHELLELLTRAPELGYLVVGTVRTASEPSAEFARLLLGEVGDINRIINDAEVEVTVIATERDRDLVPRLMTETAVADTTIKIVPDLYDLVSGQARAQHLYGVPLIEINSQIMEPWQRHMKRLVDIAFALGVLLLGLPAWLVVAAIIKLQDGGPIFYSQERVGLGGRRFMMHKFRSMRTDAEKAGISWAAVNDPRVTPMGSIMRKLHLDEIPQFWNVLVGDMSIVGPRPERPFYVEKFTEMIPAYPRRLRVKPGVTGWNQVHVAEVVETVEFLQERLRHDFFYIENVSLRLDIEIIFRTIIRVIQRKGQA
jgi:exopolysaccharide biosynthesis polyprenyl glycosylphosphotransferase